MSFTPLRFGRLDDRARLADIGGQRLLDQDVLAGLDHAQRRGFVGVVGGRDAGGDDVAVAPARSMSVV